MEEPSKKKQKVEGGFEEDVEEEASNANEGQFGIKLYLTNCKGIGGKLKVNVNLTNVFVLSIFGYNLEIKKYFDFVVNEVDEEGKIVELTDTKTLPDMAVEEVLQNILLSLFFLTKFETQEKVEGGEEGMKKLREMVGDLNASKVEQLVISSDKNSTIQLEARKEFSLRYLPYLKPLFVLFKGCGGKAEKEGDSSAHQNPFSDIGHYDLGQGNYSE